MLGSEVAQNEHKLLATNLPDCIKEGWARNLPARKGNYQKKATSTSNVICAIDVAALIDILHCNFCRALSGERGFKPKLNGFGLEITYVVQSCQPAAILLLAVDYNSSQLHVCC